MQHLSVYHHRRSLLSFWESWLGNAIHIYRLSIILPHPLTPAMSQSQTTVVTSSRFQAIFHAAVKSYQKETKTELIAHPLASQLQSCDSTSAILAILQDQVREFDKSRSGDERLTKWLSPTVNVLTALSATVAGGVGLVGLDRSSSKHPLIFRRYFRLRP